MARLGVVLFAVLLAATASFAVPTKRKLDYFGRTMDNVGAQPLAQDGCIRGYVRCQSGDVFEMDGVTHRCIPDHYVCDNWNDCGDASDESLTICAPNICDTNDVNEWQCPNTNVCIYTRWLCDQWDDCGDDIDETPMVPDEVCQLVQDGDFAAVAAIYPGSIYSDAGMSASEGWSDGMSMSADTSMADGMSMSADTSMADGMDNGTSMSTFDDVNDANDTDSMVDMNGANSMDNMGAGNGMGATNMGSQTDDTGRNCTYEALPEFCTQGSKMTEKHHFKKGLQLHGKRAGPCEDGEFKCQTVDDCIPADWFCDDWADCDDASDEPLNDPACPLRDCEADDCSYRCDNINVCVYAIWRCDYEDDCRDGSEERNCPAQNSKQHKTRKSHKSVHKSQRARLLQLIRHGIFAKDNKPHNG